MPHLFRPINRKPSAFSTIKVVDAVNDKATVGFEIVGNGGLYGFQLDFSDIKNSFFASTGILWLKDIKNCLDKQVDILYSRTARGQPNPITFTANHSFMTMSQDKITNGFDTYVMKIHQFCKDESVEMLNVTTSTVANKRYYAIYNIKVPARDSAGNVILEQEIDENGQPVFKPDGKPKMVVKMIDEPHYIYILTNEYTPNLQNKSLYRNSDGYVFYFDSSDTFYSAWGFGTYSSESHCVRPLEFSDFNYNVLSDKEKANYIFIGTFSAIPDGSYFKGYNVVFDNAPETFIARTRPTLSISFADHPF